MAAPGRRFLIAVGVGAYADAGIDDLPGVPRDVARVRELLERMDYMVALPELAADPGKDLAERIEDWVLETDLGPRDAVFVYFAGHGVKAADRRHYLLCADSRSGRYTTALASEDLCRPLMTSSVGHLLVVLDTCYAGAGTEDIAKLAAELASLQRGAAGRWMMAAARGKERARENAFVEALSHALAQPRAGAHQEYLGVREVTERVNEYFREKHPAQHARHSTIDSDGHAPFFQNWAHIPGLPADDLDVETLTRLRRQTRGHFEARGRGVEHTSDRGDYFTGRTAALAVLASWLGGQRHDRKARVITGNPGSGKSSLLGRFLMLTDVDSPVRAIAPERALPPAGLTVVRLHARRVVLEDLVTDLSAAVNLPEGSDRDDLLDVLGERSWPIVVVVDALDEAGTAGDTTEGNRIARELLQPLSTLPAVRLIVGTRRPLIPALGRAVVTLDLDLPEHITSQDVTDYACALLLDAQDSDSCSPYVGLPDEAAKVAKGIASRAGASFLVARMAARALVHGQITVNTTRAGWETDLPSDAGQAFAAYLARFGPDRPKVERLLRPLAYAQGAGLPWSTLWAPLAEALSGIPCPQEDLRWLHEHAGAYLVESSTAAGSAYRLFHETLAEHLRERGDDTTVHQVIASTLLASVPHDARTARRDWPAAHPYLRDHLATHAAAGNCLDSALHDSDFLVHATPAHLLRAFHATNSDECRLRCAIYRASAAVHSLVGPEQRRDVLAIDAARYAEHGLAQELSQDRSWRPRWATGSLIHPALHSTLTGHTDRIGAVACTAIDGRPHAITGGDDNTVRVWDLTDGSCRASLAGHTGAVNAVACTAIEGRPHAITGGDDDAVHVWDLTDGSCDVSLTGHAGFVSAVACTVIDGRPHAITGSDDTTVRVWDLTDGSCLASLAGHTDTIGAVACTAIDGRPHAITGGEDNTVRVWDLTDGSCRASLAGHTGAVYAVACTAIEGRPHAITGGEDNTVRVWDLTDGSCRASLAGHTGAVYAVACTAIEGRPHAITGGDDETVRVWDLTDGSCRASLAGHTDTIGAVACMAIDGRPHTITGSDDNTVRVWDLTDRTTGATSTGHTNWIRAVACTAIDGRPHAITGGYDNTVRVWDLRDGSCRASLAGHADFVNAVACTAIDGRPHAITGGDDNTVRVWDLTDGTCRASLAGHTGAVNAVACTAIDGRPHAITGSDDTIVRVWDLTDGSCLASLAGHTDTIGAVACTAIDGRPHAITGSDDNTVRVWDLTDGTCRASLAGHTCAVACTAIDGRPHAITGGYDNTVRVWDPTDGTRRASLAGHADFVNAVACMVIDGRPHAISGGDDNTVHVWDLALHRIVETFTLPLPIDVLAVSGNDIVIGMRNEVVVLTRASSKSL
ncbi:caspase family protein [Streptomyces canus]|uniref:caspase family protein n=1 Tax=Streptomyces canus TaxID=58343 RepID=UPI002E30FDEA|nr:caspase family protein [Streptomyces canus]